MADAQALRSATGIAPTVNNDRLTLARETQGWTQRELARQLEERGYSISTAALSQLESGRTRPSPKTLLAISEATGFPVEYFARRRTDGHVAGFFRSLRSAPARERKRALAKAHLLHDLAQAIELHIDLPGLDIPTYELDGPIGDRPDAVEEAAGQLRRAWGLGVGPIDNMVVEVERHGAIAARLRLDRYDLDAFSVWFPDRPVVVLGNDKGVYGRSRFDAAHELGHLVMHRPEDAGTKAAEREAHAFAAAFLMPAKSIADLLPRQADWRLLMTLKAEWGVSMGALLYRAKTLGVMTDARYTSAMKFMSAKGWRREEPGDKHGRPAEVPRLLTAALRELESEGVTLRDIVAEAGLPHTAVQELVTSNTQARRRVVI